MTMDIEPIPPTFSIVIPTHNEQFDIGDTCEAILRLVPQPEVIFVDGASVDETTAEIKRYLVPPRMRLIVEPTRRGVAAARNVGALSAAGEIVVFLNADVQLPSDFLTRILRHYEEGADYVAVEAQVINTESVFGRFQEAQHRYFYGGDNAVGWTEGFSCRRALALRVGLFSEELPGAGGEDGEFVQRLDRETKKGVIDKSIIVRHITPSTLRDFWLQWQGRGISVPFLRRRVHHVGWTFLIAERAAAGLWSLVLGLAVLPAIGRAVALAPHSERRWSDLTVFVGLTILQVVAHRVGEWKGLFRLCRMRISDAR